MKVKTANNISGAAVMVAVYVSVFLHESALLAVISISPIPIALLTTWLIDHDKS